MGTQRLLLNKSEFALERLEKDVFSQRLDVEARQTLSFDGLPRATESGVDEFTAAQLKAKYVEPVC